MKLLSLFLVLLLITLQLTLWFGDDSLAEVWQLRQQINAQKDENKQLQERNAALEAEVQDLKQGLAAIEERARNELGMVKKDETFFQVVEEEDGAGK
jgi:cell division protein FtsB